MNHTAKVTVQTVEFVEFQCSLCDYQIRLWYSDRIEILQQGDGSLHSGATARLELQGVGITQNDELDVWRKALNDDR